MKAIKSYTYFIKIKILFTTNGRNADIDCGTKCLGHIEL